MFLHVPNLTLPLPGPLKSTRWTVPGLPETKTARIPGYTRYKETLTKGILFVPPDLQLRRAVSFTGMVI